MRNKILAVAAFAAVAVFGLGSGIASAQVYHQDNFQPALINLEARVLGISPVAIQFGMMRGESLAQIAFENGINPMAFQRDLAILSSLVPQYIQQSFSVNRINRNQFSQWNNWWHNEHGHDQDFNWNNHGNNNHQWNNNHDQDHDQDHDNNQGGSNNHWNGNGSNGGTWGGNNNSTSSYHH